MNSLPDVTWEETYDCYTSLTAYGSVDLTPRFEPVLVTPHENPNLRIQPTITDWWPVRDIAKRRAALNERGLLGVRWDLNKGTLRTVEMLARVEGDDELAAATWIGAWLWDSSGTGRRNRPLPEGWPGDSARLLMAMGIAVNDYLKSREVPFWYYPMTEALPYGAPGLRPFRPPESVREAVDIATISASVALSAWRLVRVQYAYGPRSVPSENLDQETQPG